MQLAKWTTRGNDHSAVNPTKNDRAGKCRSVADREGIRIYLDPLSRPDIGEYNVGAGPRSRKEPSIADLNYTIRPGRVHRRNGTSDLLQPKEAIESDQQLTVLRGSGKILRVTSQARCFPTPQSVIRLLGAILLEQGDEWAVAERRYFSAESMKQLTAPALPATAQEIFAAIA
jgi:hypothetical protein